MIARNEAARASAAADAARQTREVLEAIARVERKRRRRAAARIRIDRHVEEAWRCFVTLTLHRALVGIALLIGIAVAMLIWSGSIS